MSAVRDASRTSVRQRDAWIAVEQRPPVFKLTRLLYAAHSCNVGGLEKHKVRQSTVKSARSLKLVAYSRKVAVVRHPLSSHEHRRDGRVHCTSAR